MSINLGFELFEDEGVYPSEELLEYISKYDILKGSSRELIELVYDCWSYPDPYKNKYDENGCCVYGLSTGGWSGNEDLIGALQDNHLWWMINWYSSKRGGHYVFKVKYD